MPDRNFYDILGISKTASADEIKKAYRKLAKDLHPDRNPGDKASEERFKDVAYAYDVLSDEKKRALYDEFGEVALKEGFDANTYRQYQAWQRGGSGAGGGGRRVRWTGGRHPGDMGGAGFEVNLEDLFEGGGLGDLFGMRGGGRARARRGADVQAEIRVGFVEALRGLERELVLQMPGESAPRTIKVRIPAGVKDGEKVRLRGQGGRANGDEGSGESGDLVLVVHVDEHPYFHREEDDLHLDLPVTASEAYRGARVSVPTLEGDVSLRIPPGTQSGAKLRLRNKGAPRRGAAKGTHGDLIVHVEIRLPPTGNERVDRLLGDLDDHYPHPVRHDLKL